ncbi:hypothetical protein QMO31_32255, partial [Pseudomonas aeruginosa]|nr:hypothetical protein [Pseudomonas aeruginosa]
APAPGYERLYDSLRALQRQLREQRAELQQVESLEAGPGGGGAPRGPRGGGAAARGVAGGPPRGGGFSPPPPQT